MAPGIPLIVSENEKPFALMQSEDGIAYTVCPHCRSKATVSRQKGESKKVFLHLFIHPDWLKGTPRELGGQVFGGSSNSRFEEAELWYKERAASLKILEFRGKELPEVLITPDTNEVFNPNKASSDNGKFVCAACGTEQRIVH